MALKRLDLRGLSDRLDEVLPRPESVPQDVTDVVAAIVARVRAEGDQAVLDFTASFDGVLLDRLAVTADEVAVALRAVPAPLRSALEVAHGRIAAYHERDRAGDRELVSDGVVVTDLVRPLHRVGCYAPGGLARYP